MVLKFKEFSWRNWKRSRNRRRTGPKFAARTFAGPASFAETMTTTLRVAHLSDQHVGLVTPMSVQMEAVRITNEAKPDLVVITGDFIAHSLAYTEELVEITKAFEAPVFGVLGNHDHWAGAQTMRRVLERGGMCVLQNANTCFEAKGERLQIVGLDDSYTGHADRREALRGLNRTLPTIGLTHIPEEADGLWAGGVPMVFAGHTHGGQVSLGRLPEMSVGRLGGHKYVHGLYGSREEPAPSGAVYVSAGIGAAVMPLRLGDRGQREVTFFELGARPGTREEHHAEQAALPGRKPSQALQVKRHRQVAKRVARRERRREIRSLFKRIRRS